MYLDRRLNVINIRSDAWMNETSDSDPVEMDDEALR